MKQKISLLNDLINKYPEQNEFPANLNSMLNNFPTYVNEHGNIESDFVKIMRSNLKQLTTHAYKFIEINNKLLQLDLIGKFPNTYDMCKKDMNKFMLMIRKGVYSYEHMDSWERLKEKVFPPIEKFDNAITQEIIIKEDHEHAKKAWNEFGIKSSDRYCNLYCKSDTLLLADVSENFRDKCLEIYRLDPLYFISASSLTLQACLKYTKEELELLTDQDMLLMFEKGTRGSLSQSTERYATANNKYMENYDQKVESSFLQDLDANNLYGWTMCKNLPVGGFEWDNADEYTEDMIKNYDENSEHGALLEVDVEYPIITRIEHRYLAFLPEQRKLDKVTKLVTILDNKENYIVHILALKQALNHGLKLRKVHRAIKFRQKGCLRAYIMMNTGYRMNAKNDFEKNFFKLMNNALFGKTTENVRKYRDIKLVTSDEYRRKLLSEPNYHTTKHFNENFMAIEMRKTKVKMNKPVYLGQAIFDISKTLIYEFYYDYLKVKHKDKVKPCYMNRVLFYTLKQEIFTKTLLMMCLNGLIHLLMMKN